jgi:hypothetical protein
MKIITKLLLLAVFNVAAYSLADKGIFHYYDIVVTLWIFGMLYIHLLVSSKLLNIDIFMPFRSVKEIQINDKYKL